MMMDGRKRVLAGGLCIYTCSFKRLKRVFSLQEIQCLRNLMREGIPERIRWSWHLAPADVALV